MSLVFALRVTHSLSIYSDRLEQILYQLSKAIISAINTTKPQHKPIQDVLSDLYRLENRPWCLTEMVYEWCLVIYKNRQRLQDEELIPLALRAGFRHFDPQDQRIPGSLAHTEHHRGLVDIVFKSEDSEAIADLLHAWTSKGRSHGPAHMLLSTCTGYLIDLYSRVHLSSRLRRLVIRSIELVGYKGFKGGGTERFVELLNRLHVGIEDMDYRSKWTPILLDTIQSSERAQHLSIHSWKLLAELTILPPLGSGNSAYVPQVTASLLEAQEWDKLECWMGVFWMEWSPQTAAIMEGVERVMVMLFCQRPRAIQKLTQWMELWSKRRNKEVPDAFQRICKQPREIVRADAP